MTLTGVLIPGTADGNVPVAVTKPLDDSVMCGLTWPLPAGGCSSADSTCARRALPTVRMRGATSPRCVEVVQSGAEA